MSDLFKKTQSNGVQAVQNSLFNEYQDMTAMTIQRPIQLGPKGHPIAELRFKDELPKIIARFQIKAPADQRLWKKAKENFGVIESKVANIEESMAADRKKGIYKDPPQYAGLLLWMIFPKKNKGT